MTRITPRAIVNAYFDNSRYMNPGLDFWTTLDFSSKQTFRQFIRKVRPGIGPGSKEQRLAAFIALIPPHLGANVAKVYAADPKTKHILASKSPNLAIAPPAIAELKQQLAIEGPKPPVKGANEASLTTSSTVAVLPSPRDLEDAGSFVGGKRVRRADSLSALKGANNVFVDPEPKRPAISTGVSAPTLARLYLTARTRKGRLRAW
jgi:hypothetical protein